METQLEAIEASLDRVGLPAWIKDPRGRYRAVGRGLAEHLGVERTSMRDRPQELFWSDRVVRRFRVDDHAAMVRRRPVVVPEYGPDQALVTLKLPLYGSGGALVGTLGVFAPTPLDRCVGRASELRRSVLADLRGPLWDRGIRTVPDGDLPALRRPVVHDPGVPFWLREARATVVERFRERWTQSDLAKRAGVHPGHLGRAFRQHYGIGVKELRNRLRIEWACVRLLSSDETAGRVALAAGFADQSHFTRVFRATLRTTPDLFRRGRRLRVGMSGEAS